MLQPGQTCCAECGKPKQEFSTETWFLLSWLKGTRFLCSRICLIRWISGDGRVETASASSPAPHRRE
jgi:endogenous inhibitor of DNA gyrase (YacG/DUF329 family)